jgi:hypothetical protein
MKPMRTIDLAGCTAQYAIEDSNEKVDNEKTKLSILSANLQVREALAAASAFEKLGV